MTPNTNIRRWNLGLTTHLRFLEGKPIKLIDKTKNVWLIVGQLPVKIKWYNALIALRDFSQSNKYEASPKELPWFPTSPPLFPALPPLFFAFPPWFPAFPLWLHSFPPYFPAFPPWFPTFQPWFHAFSSFPSFLSPIPNSGFYR